MNFNVLIKNLRLIYGKWFLAKQCNFVPQVVVRVDGGLASQMWQYALGLGCSKFSGLPVSYDLSWYEDCGRDIQGKARRKFSLLRVFPHLSFKIAKFPLIDYYIKYFNYKLRNIYSYEEWVYQSEAARYLDGYYVHSKYIDLLETDLLGQYFFNLTLPSRSDFFLWEIKKAQNSVGIHVRRGDYVGSVHDVVTMDYYRNAVSYISEKLGSSSLIFFVFSNDITWSRENFSNINGEFVFVDANGNDHGEIDMYLMSQCRHQITTNSGFGRWAAFLNPYPYKLVTMPDRWMKDADWTSGSNIALRKEGWVVLPS